MKNTLLFLSFWGISFISLSQNKTLLDSAVNTPDYLCKYEVLQTSTFKDIRLDAVKQSNLENFSSVSGIKVMQKLQVGKEWKKQDSYLDKKEVDGLLMTLQYIKTMLKSMTMPANYTEIKFTTISGFQVSLYTILNDKNKLDWKFAVQTNITNEKTFIDCNFEDISRLEETLTLLKTKF